MADQKQQFQIQGMPGQMQNRMAQGAGQQVMIPQYGGGAAGAEGMMVRRMASREGMESYYSNCAVVASSPREISVLFGRYVTPPPGSGSAELNPVYERQIYMTVEQAEDLAKALVETVRLFKAKANQQD
jgi:hypothetical protein